MDATGTMVTSPVASRKSASVFSPPQISWIGYAFCRKLIAFYLTVLPHGHLEVAGDAISFPWCIVVQRAG